MDQDPKAGRIASTSRVLALELRSHRFGYVVLEGVTRVLDCGVRTCRWGGHPVAPTLRGKAAVLMDCWHPTAVVVQRPIRRAAVAALFALHAEARHRSIPMQRISLGTVEGFFADWHCASKHERAKLLAEWFEVLEWKLPAKRRIWENEPHNTIMFDAVANAVAFLARD